MSDSFDLDIFYIFLGIFILFYLLIYECTNQFFYKKSKVSSVQTKPSYCYGKCNGPHTWYKKFKNASGENQSPINLMMKCALNIHTETLKNPLQFSYEYQETPRETHLLNDGHTINIYPKYECDRPTIRGGPLDGVYELCCLNFRWGEDDEDGTEHMINNSKFSMEIQVIYTRIGHKNLINAAEAGDVAIISYFYQVTSLCNPYFNIIFENLENFNGPFLKYPLETIPISLIAPCFSKNYFSYVGSLTFPPCTEGVKWIIQPEPLSISYEQMKKFRKTKLMYCECGHSNLRPVQEINGREIMFYE